MKTNESAPALKPGYYVAVPTGEPATKAWGVRPGVVEYCDPECGDPPHFRNAADHRMYEDPRDIGYTLYPIADLTAPASVSEGPSSALRPSAHQEQETERVAYWHQRYLDSERHANTARLERDEEAANCEAYMTALDAAQATAERLIARLAKAEAVVEAAREARANIAADVPAWVKRNLTTVIAAYDKETGNG